MKKIFQYTSLALAGAMLMASCKKNEIKYGDFELVGPDKALFKVNNLSQYKTNPTVVFTIDGKRVNNPITARTPFPGGGLNTGGGSTANYMLFASGSHEFRVVIPSKVTNEDSLELYKTNINLEGGNYQTLHITDTGANTFSTLITDVLQRPDSGKVKYVFLNLMPDAPALDLYYDSTLLASNVAYKSSVEFSKPSSLTAAKPGWWARQSGAAPGTKALVAYATEAGVISSQLNQRVFTIFTSGYASLAGTDTRRPFLSFVFNL